MEASQIMEEQDNTTTINEKEHPSTKEPADEDLQALPTTETPLEPLISQTPLDALAAETLLDSFASQTSLEILVSKSPLELSIPETPLESHTSNPPLVPSTSQMTLVPPASESPLKPSIPMTSISNIPLEAPTAETDISKVPEKHLIFLPLSVTHACLSSDVLKEDLLSESPSKELPEFEHLLKHSLSGPSAHVCMDTSAKQKEEAEDKDIVDTSGITAFTAQPGHQLGKKKRKKGIIRLYIGWRCPHYLWDCYRIGNESKCFCGHLLKQHQIISDISVPCTVNQCRCLMFCFIPSRPEEVGIMVVPATVLNLISSVRPATDAGRNMRLSLRLRRPDDEEGGLMGYILSTTGTGLSEPSHISNKVKVTRI
ncbi:LOW QUALITY PROTEIN: protein FAM221B [Fukomys damarensis]|uniref:LOW QUALITY PROTEIN: protein FAM221B n=1 Tax=Fukomys damarensis TaxID=885580 RepID=UPI00053FCF13|nr:LOW QUALITY PROTEIN: protein FAM221B [Fukomys damarensis]